MEPKFYISLALTLCAFVITVYLFIAVIVIPSNKVSPDTSHAMNTDPSVPKNELNHPGQKIFEANCKPCHRIDRKLVGPALGGVLQRRDSLWVVKIIRNSSQLISSGDKTAVKLINEYNKTVMTSFSSFSDSDLKNLLAYLKLEGDDN